MSPRIALIYSREQASPITAKKSAWDPHWLETPVAVWLKGFRHAVIAASIPYVSFQEGLRHNWKEWLIVNRTEAAAALNLLCEMLAHPPKRVVVIGGNDIPLPSNDPDWDSLVLDSQIVDFVKRNFEFFLVREAWFRDHRLPFRRGYLLHGPPGNGKTSVVRAMACHPDIRAFTLDFSNEALHNDALTHLFESACHAAPSLVIFEDLERLYGIQADGQNRTQITLQHLLNCLDGLGNREGTIVVATANHPEQLDPAILRRPGRFDRVVLCPTPKPELRSEYLQKVAGNSLDPSTVSAVSKASEGFSFAQLREAYILAGQLTFQRDGEQIRGEDLLDGVRGLRNWDNGMHGRLGERGSGFISSDRAAA